MYSCCLNNAAALSWNKSELQKKTTCVRFLNHNKKRTTGYLGLVLERLEKPWETGLYQPSKRISPGVNTDVQLVGAQVFGALPTRIAKKKKKKSIYNSRQMSPCSHVTRTPLNGISWNIILHSFLKSVSTVHLWSRVKLRTLCVKTYSRAGTHLQRTRYMFHGRFF